MWKHLKFILRITLHMGETERFCFNHGVTFTSIYSVMDFFSYIYLW